MTEFLMFGLDLVAIGILVFAIYFPRHRRREMVVAYLAGNVGILAVANALASSAVGIGLGLGIFGVLSIIRLRSLEMNQAEIAYYFSSLALGLVGGIPMNPAWMAPLLMAAILIALYAGDHPSLFGGYRYQVVTLDAAYADEAAVIRRLEQMLSTRVHRLAVRKVDLVTDTTLVEVVHEPRNPAGAVSSEPGALGTPGDR